MIWELRRGPSDARSLRRAYNERHERGFLRDRDRFYAWIARLVRRDARGAVLNVGCGGGYFLREIHPLPAYGVEISDVALKEARAAAPKARFALSLGERLPYRRDSFDAVVCLGNVEHFLDPAQGVREMARVLAPSGRAWILVPNLFYSGAIWRVIRTGYGPDHHQPVERFATRSEWHDFFEANGLRVLSVKPYNRFKWWKRLLPSALAYHFLFVCHKQPPGS